MAKSYKREVAVSLLVWLVYLVETKDVSIIEVLVWPVFSFAAAAFGFDAYSKLQQWSTRASQPPESSVSRNRSAGEYSSGEREQPSYYDK